MKKRVTLLFIGLLLILVPTIINAQATLEQRLKKHVYTLANDTLYGRETGTQYAHIAADYIVEQFKDIGLSPYNSAGSYFQFFDIHTMKHAAVLGYKNIIGVLEGNDPVLKNEYIVVGAHYDHLGYKEIGNDSIAIYNGADDNASGVATLIELARNLKDKQAQLKRSVILIAFDAEEIGLYGSQHFAAYPTVPINSIKMMFSVDMVGWYKVSGKVKYEGTGTLSGGNSLINNPSIVPTGLKVVTEKFEKSIFTATDTEPFAKKAIPTFAVTTGTKSPYHKPEDEADLIDYKGMELITEHLIGVILTASQNVQFRSSGRVASKHRVNNRLVTFGITTSVGSNHHHYTSGPINGKNLISYSVGLQTQFNGKWFGIRPEVLYEYVGAKHPAGNIRTDNLTIPLSFVIQTPEYNPIGADVFVGAYYSHRFNGKQADNKLDFTNDFRRNEGGWSYGFGFKINKIRLSYTRRYGLTNMTRVKNADKAHIRNRANYFTISYIF